jgi:hypothetical protein
MDILRKDEIIEKMLDLEVEEWHEITGRHNGEPMTNYRIYREMLKTCYADIQALKKENKAYKKLLGGE